MNTTDITKQVKRKCRMVKPIGKGWYQSVYHHLCFAHKLDMADGVLRIAIPHVAKNTDYNMEKLVTAINETNCKVKYVKTTILQNGSISLNYDHKITDGEDAAIIVPRIFIVKTAIIMKRILLLLSILAMCVSMNAQSDYYMKQARSFQREAEYYTKQAQGYDREVDYYNRQAQGYLREAEYYSKREKYDQVRNYQRRAKDASDKAESYKRKANFARDKAKSYMRKAENALQNAKK